MFHIETNPREKKNKKKTVFQPDTASFAPDTASFAPDTPLIRPWYAPDTPRLGPWYAQLLPLRRQIFGYCMCFFFLGWWMSPLKLETLNFESQIKLLRLPCKGFIYLPGRGQKPWLITCSLFARFCIDIIGVAASCLHFLFEITQQ